MASVGPGAAQPVKFTVTKSQPGTYTVDIGGQRDRFVVLGAYNNSAPNTSAVIALVATFISGLLIIIAVMLFRRRAY